MTEHHDSAQRERGACFSGPNLLDGPSFRRYDRLADGPTRQIDGTANFNTVQPRGGRFGTNLMGQQKSNLPDAHEVAFASLGSEAQRTYSQVGEDLAIIHYLGHKRAGRYVDVGCHHPFRFSNTALLHESFGWRGINVDADPRAIEACKRYRPSDINLHYAVGPTEQEVQVAIFPEGAVNSVLPQVYEANRLQWGEPTMMSVLMKPLTAILDENLLMGETVDFLNVDVEGLDLQVLQTLDWSRYRPHVVAAEVHDLALEYSHNSKTVQFMKGNGYSLRSFSVMTALFCL